jgi:hypothetical protein
MPVGGPSGIRATGVTAAWLATLGLAAVNLWQIK